MLLINTAEEKPKSDLTAEQQPRNTIGGNPVQRDGLGVTSSAAFSSLWNRYIIPLEAG